MKKTLSVALLIPLSLSQTQAAISWGETITAGQTEIKADHINEIRTQIQDLETQLSGAGQWVDGAGGVINYAGGNVGIGDTSPSERLSVAGSIGIGDSSTSSGQLILHGSTAGKYSRIFTSNGNLHVDAGFGSGGDDNLYLNYYNGSDIFFGTGGTSTHSSVTSAGAWNLDSTLYTDGSGNVGIGVPSPDAKLDVNGIIQSNTHIQSGANSGGVALTVNDGYGNANVTFNHLAGRAEQNGNGGRIEVNTDETTNGFMQFRLGSGLTSGATNNLSTIMKLQADGNVGIGTANPSARLHVQDDSDLSLSSTNHAATFGIQGDANIGIDNNEIMARNNGAASSLYMQRDGGGIFVGPQASGSTYELMDVSRNFDGDGNYYQITSSSTTTGTTTANRSTYGANFALTNNRAGSTAGNYSYGYGVRGYVAGTTGQSYYNTGGTFEGRNNSTSGMVHLRGVVGVARQYDDDGGSNIPYVYGMEGQALGRSSTSSNPGSISNAKGVYGYFYPYASNATTADGISGYVSTNNSYGGSITSAYGARGAVRNDSDDGSNITNAFGGHFTTSKRGTATNIGSAYGVYASATGGNTNFGVYSANGDNYFAGDVGIGTATPTDKLHINGGDIKQSGGSNTIRLNDTDHNDYLIHNNSNRIYFMHDSNDNNNWDDGDDDRITMYSDGNGLDLGIGTSSPTSGLHIAHTYDVGSANDTRAGVLIGANTAQLAIDGNEMQSHDGTAAINYTFNPFGGGVRFNSNAGGRFEVGINHVSGDYGTVTTEGEGKGGWEGYSINGREVFMNNAANDQVGIFNDSANRWRIWWDADDMTIRHTNNHAILHADQGARTYLYYNNAWKLRTNNGGASTNGTHQATAFTYTSDKTLKENIKTVSGLDLITKLRGVTFDWKKDKAPAVGLIAQEVETVLPELVSTDEKGLKSVQYGNLVAPLIEAVKEQQAQIEALQQEVNALKN